MLKGGIVSRWALHALTRPRRVDPKRAPEAWEPALLGPLLKPADVLLVEGDQRISSVVSYLTTSPWSHAAIYVGDLAPADCVSEAEKRWGATASRHLLVEAQPEEGVVSVPLETYRRHLVRICRPRALRPEDAREVVLFVVEQIGKIYDVDNIVDLARYFLPAGIVPARLRREALHFGAGKPTEVICSSLIASAFAHVSYPILPLSRRVERRSLMSRIARRLLGDENSKRLRFRRAPTTLIVPRDFDLSPYFEVVKPPTPEISEYRRIPWDTQPEVLDATSMGRRRMKTR